TMSGIEASSRKIADIISVIDGIAFQTNILALNAAVEAARAGEQGRGFAVVASEVRTLAQRSSHAAKEIKDLIDDSVGRVAQGSALVDQAGKTMQEIVASVQRVTDIMGEISAASQEQSAGIEQVNQTVMQMDEATQQNAALVEEATAAARSMEDQAGQLSQAVALFKIDQQAPTAPRRQPLREPDASPSGASASSSRRRPHQPIPSIRAPASRLPIESTAWALYAFPSSGHAARAIRLPLFGITALLIYAKSSQALLTSAKAGMTNAAYLEAKRIAGDMNTAFSANQALANAMLVQRTQDGNARANASEIMRRELQQHPDWTAMDVGTAGIRWKGRAEHEPLHGLGPGKATSFAWRAIIAEAQEHFALGVAVPKAVLMAQARNLL
ncbi:methyl-accepting chemotaxis protein, partial [Pantoea ananatis]|uniref:methyl-accepting chemotaxis protein n=1 Tax=Pantoea ananas TaxID=553 RepID=UPI0039B9265C